MKSVSAQCQYSVTVVASPPCPPFSGTSVHFLGLNDLGQACGEMGVCGQVGALRPIVWTPEHGLIILPLPEGVTRGQANDINNVLGSAGIGQVACTLSVPEIGNLPFLYDDGVWTEIPLPPVNVIWEQISLNDNTEVVGTMNNPITGPMRGFHWRDGVVTVFDLPLGPDSMASALNEASAIAGSMGAAIVDSEGYVLSDQGLEIIPTLRDATSHEPSGINIWGIACGVSRIAVKSGSVPRRSWVYQNGQVVELGGFPNTHQSIARDINDVGQTVGSSYSLPGGNGETSYLWHEGELIRLDDLFEMPPGVGGLAAVTAINNHGQIAGYTSGAAKGIILTPIDVPLGDVDLDCEVDGWDLALLLGAWGDCKPAGSCPADFVSSDTFQPPPDGVVDGADLASLLGSWTEQHSTSSGRK